MEIKAKSKFDYETIKALTHLNWGRKKDPKKKYISDFVTCLVLMAVVGVELIFIPNTTLICMLGLVFIVLLIDSYLYFILPKIRYNALGKMKDADNEYIFCDNVLKAYTETAEYSGESDIQYSLFINVWETSKYFFLHQPSNQFLVIDKSTITGGSVEDIRNKLLEHVTKKYIICKY